MLTCVLGFLQGLFLLSGQPHSTVSQSAFGDVGSGHGWKSCRGASNLLVCYLCHTYIHTYIHTVILSYCHTVLYIYIYVILQRYKKCIYIDILGASSDILGFCTGANFGARAGEDLFSLRSFRSKLLKRGHYGCPGRY